MALSQEEIDKAIEDQKKYWNELYSRMIFFKKTDVTIDIINELFSLENYSTLNDCKNKCLNNLNTNHMHFARYWASDYLENHLNFMWLLDYEESRKSLNEKQSNAQADDKRTERRKIFDLKYP